MTRTLVINPPFLEPHRPPISCAIIAEISRLAGHEVTMLDINIELFRSVGNDNFMQYQTNYLFGNDPETKQQLQNFVQERLSPNFLKQFDWILVSCFSTWEYSMTAMIVQHCKAITTSKIVIGGPGVHTKGRELYEKGYVDYWVAGEGEIALKKIFEGDLNHPGINGIPPEQIMDIENLPLPNYDFFNLKDYDWLLKDPDVFIYGSRGCVRACTFCDVASYWPKFRWRSGKSIANEMIANYEKHGIKNFFFADSLLNGNLKEFRVFLDIMSRYPDASGFRWGGFAIVRPRASHPAELFDQIKAAGGRFMSIGVETGVDRIRLSMKKHFTNDDVDWHLENSQRIGLQNMFLTITSWYDETLAEHHEYLEIFKRWQNYAVDGTIFGVAVNPPLAVLPGAPLGTDANNLVFELADEINSFESLLWTNPDHPELTFVERFRRAVEITKEASRYNWNIQNKHVKLNEIKASLQSYLDLKSKNLLKTSIPIKSGRM